MRKASYCCASEGAVDRLQNATEKKASIVIICKLDQCTSKTFFNSKIKIHLIFSSTSHLSDGVLC